MSFVHLHCHSEYSLLDGMSKVPDLCQRVAEIGQTAVAITDHGWMASAVKFVAEAEEAGVKPIIGSELYIAPDMEDKTGTSGGNYHLTVLAQNEEGYRNLMRLTSLAHLRGFHYKPRVDLATLFAHSAGLIVLSGCIQGQINQNVVEGKEKAALKLLREYVRVFGDRFFVEAMYHGCGDDGIDLVHNRDEKGGLVIQEYELADWLADVAQKEGIPLVATNDAHYLTRADGDAHDTLLCLGMGAWKHKEDRMRYPGEQEGLYEFYVKDEDEMKECTPGGYWDEACDNTQVVADMVDEKVIPKHGLILPRYEIPRDIGFECWRTQGVLL